MSWPPRATQSSHAHDGVMGRLCSGDPVWQSSVLPQHRPDARLALSGMSTTTTGCGGPRSCSPSTTRSSAWSASAPLPTTASASPPSPPPTRARRAPHSLTASPGTARSQVPKGVGTADLIVSCANAALLRSMAWSASAPPPTTASASPPSPPPTRARRAPRCPHGCQLTRDWKHSAARGCRHCGPSCLHYLSRQFAVSWQPMEGATPGTSEAPYLALLLSTRTSPVPEFLI